MEYNTRYTAEDMRMITESSLAEYKELFYQVLFEYCMAAIKGRAENGYSDIRFMFDEEDYDLLDKDELYAHFSHLFLELVSLGYELVNQTDEIDEEGVFCFEVSWWEGES